MKEDNAYVEKIFEHLQSHDLTGLTEDVRFYQMHTHANENRQIDIYFDTSSIIDLHIGMEAVYRAGILLPAKFKHHSGLVHAMAYDGWLGPIHMLPKHQEEFINKFQADKRLFPNETNSSSFRERRKEILDHFSRQLPDLSQGRTINAKELKKLENNSLLIYYLIFLLRDKGLWKSRFKSLRHAKEGRTRIVIDNDYEVPDNIILRKKLFSRLFDELSQQRANRSINNFQDAIALCQLNEMLRNNESNPTESIPVYFSTRNTLINAVNNVVDQFYADDEVRPFHYRAYDGSYHLIIRDSDYFIIKGISTQLENLDREDNLKKFKQSLLEFEPQIAGFPAERRFILTQETFELSLVNFLLGFMESWLGKHAAKKLAEIYKEVPDDQELQQELDKYIAEERELLLKRNEKARMRNSIIDQLWVGLESVNRLLVSMDQEFKPLPTDASELEARFGFGEEARLEVEKLLHKINEHAAEHFDGPPTLRLRRIGDAIRPDKADIITDILEAFESDGTYGSSSDKENQQRLETGLGALWMLDRHRSIDKICTLFKEKCQRDKQNQNFLYPHYRIGLIHAAAILNFRGNISAAEKVICEIKKYQQQISHPSYKINIGLSYLYSIMWEKEISPDPFLIPERALHENPGLLQGRGINYLLLGEKAAQDALSELEEHQKNSELTNNRSHYLRKEYYLYNNIVFLRTYGSSAGIFRNIETKRFKERLYNSLNSIELAQPARFHDTLARYYLRLAALEAYDSPPQESWLNQAHRHSLQSINISQKDKEIYFQLRNEIGEIKNEEWFRFGKAFYKEA